MNKFNTVVGLTAPLDRPNVDTDAIIPKQFLKSIKRSGFGVNLFDEWRYLDIGEPDQDCSQRPINPDFVLNQPRYQGAQILLARDNFGCGSSREHAPWALSDYGFQVIIAPSFADIFFNNCFKNGILPIVLDSSLIDTLFEDVNNNEGYQLTVNLEEQTVAKPDGTTLTFDIESSRKENLLNGYDDIALSLLKVDKISAYEQQRQQQAPWLFPST